jgi:hypothetical protein
MAAVFLEVPLHFDVPDACKAPQEDHAMKTPALVILALAIGTTAAVARQCPQDMAKIDAAMKTAQLSPADKAQVQKLRQDGEALHKAGKHPESEATLAKAKAILNVK